MSAADGARPRAATYALAVVSGGGLFFLCFAAVFTGQRPLLIVVVLAYAAAGALGVRTGGAEPARLAVALVALPAPWMLQLFVASIAEAGVPRALLWPALLGVAWALAWLGGRAAGAHAARHARSGHG